jgi:hypothetical protein
MPGYEPGEQQSRIVRIIKQFSEKKVNERSKV